MFLFKFWLLKILKLLSKYWDFFWCFFLSETNSNINQVFVQLTIVPNSTTSLDKFRCQLLNCFVTCTNYIMDILMFKFLFFFQNWKVFATNLTLVDAAHLLNSSLLFFSDRFRDFLFVSSFSSPSSYKTYICKRTSELRMRKF